MKVIRFFAQFSLPKLLAFYGLCSGSSGCAAPASLSLPSGPDAASPADLTPDGAGSILADATVNRYGLLAADGLLGSSQLKLSPLTPVQSLRLQPMRRSPVAAIRTASATTPMPVRIKKGCARRASRPRAARLHPARTG